MFLNLVTNYSYKSWQIFQLSKVIWENKKTWPKWFEDAVYRKDCHCSIYEDNNHIIKIRYYNDIDNCYDVIIELNDYIALEYNYEISIYKMNYFNENFARVNISPRPLTYHFRKSPPKFFKNDSIIFNGQTLNSRSALDSIVRTAGGKTTKRLTPETTLVVSGSSTGPRTLLNKAWSNHIKIITEQEFYTLVKELRKEANEEKEAILDKIENNRVKAVDRSNIKYQYKLNLNDKLRFEIMGIKPDINYNNRYQKFNMLTYNKLNELIKNNFIMLDSYTWPAFMEKWETKYDKIYLHGYIIGPDRSDYNIKLEGMLSFSTDKRYIKAFEEYAKDRFNLLEIKCLPGYQWFLIKS